jgi:hypothetical protein
MSNYALFAICLIPARAASAQRRDEDITPWQLRRFAGTKGGVRTLLGCLWIFAFLLPLHFLIALDWKSARDHGFAELPVPKSGKTGFTPMPGKETGILFTHVLTEERGLSNQIFMSGSGLAAGDVDGDGGCDLYFCNLDGPNALYRNLGSWKFEEIAARAGVACKENASTGAVLADVDGDGHLDLLVSSIGRGVRLFLNDGKGAFTENTAAAGLASHTGSMSMALADIDGDGDLDLYVANYQTSTMQDEPGIVFRVGFTNDQPTIRLIDGQPPTTEAQKRYRVDPVSRTILENGEADVLYRNDGAGKFTPISWTDGSFLDEDGQRVSVPYDWSYTAMFRDMNQDGAPDIYVCNDADSIDRIWLNDGAGRFKAMARLAIRHTSFSSMGVDFADLNRDGHDDFFVADMLSREHAVRQTLMADRRPFIPPGQIDNRPQYGHNTLFFNRGDGTYAEVAQFSGVEASDWSWTPVFLDVDLDGFEDLLITTGLERSLRNADARAFISAERAARKLSKSEFLNLRKRMPRLQNPNFAFRNRGDMTFELVSGAWGFDSRQVSHGMALADLDNDGDLDVIVNCMNGPPLIYRNDSVASRLAVRLKGKAPNTRGVGAKIRMLGAAVTQSQEMISGGRYLSGDDAMRVFACGAATNSLSLEVTWRSGKRSLLADVKPNRIYEADESGAQPAADRRSPMANRPLFKDVSELLQHQHYEQGYDDLERQRLLPRRFSQLGPGVSCGDFNNDGRDDVIIGCGHGGALGLYANNGRGGFDRIRSGHLTGKFTDDVAAVLALPAAPQSGTLLVAVANYEGGQTNAPPVRQFEFLAGGVDAGVALPSMPASAGPMAWGDVSGNGQITLFVGGRIIGGRYPEAASSGLYRKVDGKFRVDEKEQKGFEKAGLVSGAVFSDLNGDGFPELILACEWGPVKVFLNRQGKFSDVTEALGLAKYRGWWNGVTTGDFDGDGRMDIVAANWGRNHRYHYYGAQPLRLYFGDANGDGSVQLLEAYSDPVLRQIVPVRHADILGQAMPLVQERYRSFAAFSQASVKEILGERMNTMQELNATLLDSTVFLNRGDRFEAVPLPTEAQWAPAFGVNVADMDGDGHEDIFMSQNFFGVDPESSRHDAGRGLWLKGDGRGKFAAVSGSDSGVLVYGEQRGSALCDYDQDGRVDLVVSQNGAQTKLYRNEGAKPGLRVRLQGPAANLTGIGAVLRLVCGGQMGPAREIHAGSGYWSQDSAVQVMAVRQTPAQIRVRWPGGKVVTADVPAGAREISVDSDGKITAQR